MRSLEDASFAIESHHSTQSITMISLFICNHDQKCWGDTNKFPPSPESILKYQLYIVRNGQKLTTTFIQKEGGGTS